MSKVKVVEADVYVKDGVHLTLSNGQNMYFESYEFTDWLESTQDLEDFEYDGGEYYDDGEGSYTPAKSIDWESAIEKFKDLETVNKFYRSIRNLVID